MRNMLIVVAAGFAAACGGDQKRVLATPEIKAATGQAEAALSSTTITAQAGIGMYSVGILAVDAIRKNQFGTLVRSFAALSSPTGAAKAASLSVRPGVTTASSTAPVTGCIQDDPDTFTAQLTPAGVGTCTAADHLEILFESGDKASITWSETSASFDLRLQATAGAWAGTDLRYQGSRSGTGTTGAASVATTGAMKYLDLANGVEINADLDIKFDFSVSEDSVDSTLESMKVSGTVNDHIASVRARQDWTFGTQRTPQSGATPQRDTLDWDGGIGIDLLKADGATVDHSVAFNVNAHSLVESLSTPDGFDSSEVGPSFGGDVRWEGTVVGNFFLKDKQTYLRWTDGAEESFDFTSVLGKLPR